MNLLNRARLRRRHIHRCLLGLERQQWRFDLDRFTGLDQHIDDGNVLEITQFGYTNFFRSQDGSLSALNC